MLDDRDVAVRTRAFAASVFALRWPAVTPPPRWFEVARELIESADRVHRWSAALGAMQLGERAQPLVPALLARVRHESDGGLRWMIAAALGRTRTGDEEVIRLLTAWLGDADVQVRWAAASAVGELGATAAIPSLFALARDSGVTEDVLRSAVAALAKLVSRAADVDAVLELLGEQQPRLEQYELIGWCDQVALAATACPTASCVRDARERLRTVQRLDGSLAGDAALSASVRIAAAARDELPSAADVDRLWEAARGGDPDYFMSEAQMPACEALVALAHWPESGVSAATLRQLLERAGDGQPGFVRADIDRLLARLPR
jgi:HEAT repeat protein